VRLYSIKLKFFNATLLQHLRKIKTSRDKLGGKNSTKDKKVEVIGLDIVDNTPDYIKSKEENFRIMKKR